MASSSLRRRGDADARPHPAISAERSDGAKFRGLHKDLPRRQRPWRCAAFASERLGGEHFRRCLTPPDGDV
jgi:hypothetical protein